MSQMPALGPIEEVVAFFARGPSREEIAAFRLSEVSQSHLRELLHRSSASSLAREEQRQLDQLALLDDIVALIWVRAQASWDR